MENISHKDKIAVMRILKDIIYADGIVDKRELAMYSDIMDQLGLDEVAEHEIDKLNTLVALSYLTRMPDAEKREFATMMGRMIAVDGDINYNEVKLYNLVVDFCDIHGEDYPAEG